MKKSTGILTIVTLALSLSVAFPAHGEARVLSFDFTVNGTWGYDYTSNSTWNIVSTTDSGSNDLEADLAYTVVSDLGNSEFSIRADQSNARKRKDANTWTSITSASDTFHKKEGRGQVMHPLDSNTLYPDLVSNASIGTAFVDDTGEFSSSAVDVNSTWTQTLRHTPYNSSQETVTVSCKLLSWTTLNGHNCAYIERTYSYAVSSQPDVNNAYTTGNLSVTEHEWFDYTNRVLVKREKTTSGILTVHDADTASAWDTDVDNLETWILAE